MKNIWLRYCGCVLKLKDEMVYIVSLVQSLKDVEDERVEMQIEDIMEEYKW